MVKFLGNPLDIPAAVTSTQAVRKSVTDALTTRVTTLEGSVAGYTVTTQTGTYTAAVNDFVLANATSAGFTITLPTGPTTGAKIAVKKTDTTGNQVTVVAGGSVKVDGDSSLVIAATQSGAVLFYDGANWQIQSTINYDTPIVTADWSTITGKPSYYPADLTNASGPLPIATGGTNATTALAARTNLGIAGSGNAADTAWAAFNLASGFTSDSSGVPGILRWRVLNQVLYIKGGVTGTWTAGVYSAVTINGIPSLSALLPAGGGSSASTFARGGAAGTGGRSGLWQIDTDGNIEFAWSSANATGATAPTWMEMCAAVPLG